jgi:hypothetical protein
MAALLAFIPVFALILTFGWQLKQHLLKKQRLTHFYLTVSFLQTVALMSLFAIDLQPHLLVYAKVLSFFAFFRFTDFTLDTSSAESAHSTNAEAVLIEDRTVAFIVNFLILTVIALVLLKVGHMNIKKKLKQS